MTSTNMTVPKRPHPLELGMLLYPGFKLLDLVGPQAVLDAHARTRLVAATLDPERLRHPAHADRNVCDVPGAARRPLRARRLRHGRSDA